MGRTLRCIRAWLCFRAWLALPVHFAMTSPLGLYLLAYAGDWINAEDVRRLGRDPWDGITCEAPEGAAMAAINRALKGSE